MRPSDIALNIAPRLEPLERRRMFSAAALQVNDIPVTGGSELSVVVSGGDQIRIRPALGGLSVKCDGVSQIYPGDFTQIDVTAHHGANNILVGKAVTTDAILQAGKGNDTLIAGGGTTTLYAGAGQDSLIGGIGADTLVAPTGPTDTLCGGAGVDSFWAQTGDIVQHVSPVETASGAVHWLARQNAQTAATASIQQPKISDTGVTYQDFAGDPLFSAAGPTENDVVQGQLGDCYFLATLAAIARTDPNQIRQDIVQLSDGTFLVRFNEGRNVYEHVDAELPAFSDGEVAYAQLGQDNSLWVAVMEKAFAIFRDNADDYANINAGWMSEVFGDLGLVSSDVFQQQESSVAPLMTILQNDLNNHEAVTVAVLDTQPDAPLISDHAYTIDAVTVQDGVVTGVTLRNPWGMVGVPGYPANNGFVTITPQQAFDNIYAITAANA